MEQEFSLEHLAKQINATKIFDTFNHNEEFYKSSMKIDEILQYFYKKEINSFIFSNNHIEIPYCLGKTIKIYTKDLLN
jgi:transketolase N-terminal domain/subunit